MTISIIDKLVSAFGGPIADAAEIGVDATGFPPGVLKTTDTDLQAVANAVGRSIQVQAGGAFYNRATNTLTARLSGGVTIAHPAIVLLVLPANLDRSSAALNMIAGGFSGLVSDLNNNGISAADLVPGGLLVFFATAFGWRVAEALPPRPQDFTIHLFMFEADNDPDYNSDPYPDPEHVLTQAKIDGAAYHTMSASATTPRVDWVDAWMPSRSLASGEAAYDDIMYLFFYAAVPVDAPNVRGFGSARFGRPGAAGISHLAQQGQPGTFNIAGVPHKFYGTSLVGWSPELDDDPPVNWELWYPNWGYEVLAFAGLPDPSPDL